MIQLYGRDERDFLGHNGRVLAEVYNDTVTWVVNAQYDFSFDYPLFAKHGLAIENEMLVTAPVPGYDDQAFRISSVEKSMGVLTVHAYHVFWDLMQNFVEDTNVVGKDGSGAVNKIMDSTQFPNEFTYSSTVGNVATARIVRMSVIAALIGTDDNTVLSRWGGEFEWDNFHFNHVAQLGQDRGVIFRNRKNLLGYKATADLSDTVTRIMPEGYNGLFLPEKYVDSPLINNYASPRIAKITYSDVKAIDEDSVSADSSTDDDALPMDEALAALRAAAKREFDVNHIDDPNYTYELNVVTLEDTEEYKNSAVFTKVYPGDTATFIHDEDGLNVKARMTGYTWSPATKQYLTLTFKSNQRSTPDIEHKIDNISNQITVIDRTATAKAANNSNTVGWASTPPADKGNNKQGDVFYQQVGIHVIMWIYRDGEWQEGVSDIAGHDAANITEGTINAANVNIINLNADNIVAGTITGPNLGINLITGEVKFQKGSISSSDEDFYIDIDGGTVSSSNDGKGTLTMDSGGINYRISKSDSELAGRIALNMYRLLGGKSTLAIQSIGQIVLAISDALQDSVNPFESASLAIEKGSIVLNSSSQKSSNGTMLNNHLGLGDSSLNTYVYPGNTDFSQVGLFSGDNEGAIGGYLTIRSNGQVQLFSTDSTTVLGNLTVTGAKNAIHVTRDGLRATPAYETAESYLGDIGEAVTDETSQIKIAIEKLFGDTVNTSIPYQVFLQSYGAAHVWVSSRNEDFFVVESDQPNAPFSWELKAKRRGYENERLIKNTMNIEDYAKKVDGLESDKND